MSTTDLIFEIGVEELPPADIETASEKLSFAEGSALSMLFQSCNIKFDKAFTYSTPRRLVLHLKDIALTQDTIIEGPPQRIAYDDGQKPTKALDSFLKKNQARLEDIKISDNNKDPRVLLYKKDISNAGILSEVLPKTLSLIDFPKKMRWNETAAAFSRPIRWIVAVFANRVIKFEYAGIVSSNITCGHRFLGGKRLKVKDPGSYFKHLKKNSVILDNLIRKERILSFLEKKNWHPNTQLLDEVTNLVESPYFIEGVFNKEYLQIPREVLLASMSKHQRIFCLQDKKASLRNHFIGVINGNYKNKKQITRNFENVLDARLKDALFFYRSDTKHSLKEWAKGLSGMVFHKELGTIAEKLERLKKIAGFVGAKSQPGIDKSDLSHAVALLKADLSTSMVKEFPSLQGVMGMYYAKDSGENESVSKAIYEHYLPRFAGDDTPASGIGIACSISDKIDNIVCYFKIGKNPKGSWDPYALRRQAIGIISIILQNNIHISLDELTGLAYELAPGKLDRQKLQASVVEFFKDRFIVFVKTRHNYSHDLIDAVLEGGLDDIYKSYLKLNSLHSIIDEICVERARVIVERTRNILNASKDTPNDIDESLLSEPEEKDVFSRFKGLEKTFLDYCKERDYIAATRLFAGELSASLDDFFNKVMVNVDQKNIRINRLSLLSGINRLYADNIADLSKLVNWGQAPNRAQLGPVPKQKKEEK